MGVPPPGVTGRGVRPPSAPAHGLRLALGPFFVQSVQDKLILAPQRRLASQKEAAGKAAPAKKRRTQTSVS
jgi:hypothetical protein